MAKPINPYQGAAPAAMAQMGQGILEAGARIGQTIQGGYESMGKGLASGINSAVSQYAQYKDDQAKFDATKKMFNAFGGSLGEKERQGIDGIFADTSMSVREKNALAPTLMQYLGAAQQQNQALAKQQQEIDARMKQAAFTEGEQTKRTGMQITSQEMQPFRQQAAGMLFNTQQPGAGFIPQNFSIQPTQSMNMFGVHQ
jgi:hypothetical protein